MSNLAFQLKEKLPTPVFTDSELIRLIEGSEDRRYSLVKRAMANGDIIQLRRGVYCLGKRFQNQPLNLFELAQKIYAPSYVSLETALSHHGWIPEASYTITSASLKRSKTFETELGIFSYTSIPKFNYIGVERSTLEKSTYLIASPTKALADYIITYKWDGEKSQELFESLRIEDDVAWNLSVKTLSEIVTFTKNMRLKKFLSSFKKDFFK